MLKEIKPDSFPGLTKDLTAKIQTFKGDPSQVNEIIFIPRHNILKPSTQGKRGLKGKVDLTRN